MDLNITKDAITKWDLKEGQLKPFSGTTIEYETPYVGKIVITYPAYILMLNSEHYEFFLIGGITKNRTDNNQEPLQIDEAFINGGYKAYNPPITFEEKSVAFLKYLYKNGGRESRRMELNSINDCFKAYASPDEFTRIMHWLVEENGYLSVSKVHQMSRERVAKLYMGVTMTGLGKEEAKAMLPQMPMVGLYAQDIATGDSKTDERINHARDLFLKKPQTMDNMRSACEALGSILEPLRDEVSKKFTKQDTQDLFQIINQFDIRHNKERTKSIREPALLEWVFNSLLNTINTYTKLNSSK